MRQTQVSPAPAPPRRQRAAWSRAMEARALCTPTDTLRAAIAQWQALASEPAVQLALAREAAQSRQPELTLAYRNVVAVGAGYRKKRTRSGKEKLTREPCVIFTVRRKWPATDKRQGDPQKLPKHLLGHTTVNGDRVLCAIPTDVQLETALFDVRPRGNSLGWTAGPGLDEAGTLGCVVEVRDGATTEAFALSAMHVFSPRPKVGAPSLFKDLSFRPMDAAGAQQTAPVIATTSEFGGVLRDQASGLPTFDVQLARPVPAQMPWLRQALANQRLAPDLPCVRNQAEFEALAGGLFELAVPANHPKRPQTPRLPMLCQFSQWRDETLSIPYRARRGNAMVDCEAFHRLLIEFEVLGVRRPLHGDSGCAVLNNRGDGTWTLIGLFIASADNAALAFAIPAWHLFDPTRYWNLPAGATLRPVNP